jgi:hypothetical protein
MASHQLYTIGTSATRITPLGTHSGLDVTIQNVNDDGYIYVGANKNVSASSYGYRIMPNHAISFELPGGDALFICASEADLNAAVITTGLEIGD